MKNRLTAIKNIAWALAIVLCLLAVFVGLLFAAFTRHKGEQFRGGVPLGAQKETADTSDSGARPAPLGDGTLMTLPETKDAGESYVDSLYFLCDSTLIGLRDFGVLTRDGVPTTHVWTTPTGVLAVADMAESKIVYPNDGSIISAANAAMIVQPSVLVVSLGNDGIANIDQFDFIEKYEKLLVSLRSASPQTWIVCLPLTSVTIDYVSNDGLTPARCAEANSWIQTACIDTGAIYCDALSAVQKDGVLLQEYAYDGRSLNPVGLDKVLMYLRTHAVEN